MWHTVETTKNILPCSSCGMIKDCPHNILRPLHLPQSLCDDCFLKLYQNELFPSETTQHDTFNDIDKNMSCRVDSICNDDTESDNILSSSLVIEEKDKENMNENTDEYSVPETEVLKEFDIDLRTIQRWKKGGFKKFVLPCKTFNDGYFGKNGNFYRREDLDKIKDLRTMPKVNTQTMPPEPEPEPTKKQAGIVTKANADAMTMFLEALKPKSTLQDLACKWYLTPSEASKLSGLPKMMILDAVKAGKIKFISQGNKRPDLLDQESLLAWKKSL